MLLAPAFFYKEAPMPFTELVEAAKREGRTLLTEVESKEMLKEVGIPVTDTHLARSPEEAVSLARQKGFPAVLKIVSPDITHKSDVGGVKLGLESAEAVSDAYEEIIQSVIEAQPKAKVYGISVQRMAQSGVEVIIGASRDAQFGPVLMFGLGGVSVEVLGDVSFRIVPITQRDAHAMVHEIKGYPILEGIRGQAAVSIVSVEEALLKISEYIYGHPEVKELDLNPIFVYQDGLVAVDARVVLDEEALR
jgi:acyl-CoA synthetase (NDP forming)